MCSEYQIPGTPRPGLCHFTYRSTSRLEGRFNSPRHPQNYPNDLNCTYLFLATPSQQVTSLTHTEGVSEILQTTKEKAKGTLFQLGEGNSRRAFSEYCDI